MCGIVGFVTLDKQYDVFEKKKFIEQALIVDTVRGGDSTGVFVVEHDPAKRETPFWCKQLDGGHSFVTSKVFSETFAMGKAADYKFVVGHNRSATIGGITIETAHPFQEGPITLVHNGTVNDSLKESRHSLGVKNDSHAICHHLAKYSPEEVIRSLDGAFSLVWHDTRDDSLNFIRNAQRPLHMAKSAKRETIYFASEGDILYWLNKRITLDLMDIVSLKPAHWLKFTPKGGMVPEVKEVELHKPKTILGFGMVPGWNKGTSYTASSSTGKNLNQAYYDHLRTETHQGPQNDKVNLIINKYKQKSADLVPTKSQEDLLNLDFSVDDAEEFVPIEAIPCSWGKMTPTVTVVGMIRSENSSREIYAMVHGVSTHTFEKAGDRVWTVMPIGTRMFAWDQPGIIARYKTCLTKTSGMVMIGKEQKPPLPSDKMTDPLHSEEDYPTHKQMAMQSDQSDLADDEDCIYPGPKHQQYTEKQWLDATMAGCVCCNRPFKLSDAWTMEWVNEDKDPCCGVCVEKICKGNLDDLPNSQVLTMASINEDGI